MTHAQLLDDNALISRWITTIGAICDKTGGEVQTGPFGSQLHASDYVNDGIPVVMPQDLHNGRIICDKIARVPESYQKTLSRHVLRSGDIVFSRRGDVTRFAVVTDTEEGWICGTGCVRIRLNSPDIIVGYVRRYLQQEVVGNWLKHHAKGVTMPNLNTSVIRALPFVYPPLPEQRHIVEVLDQAEALRAKRCATLAEFDGLTRAVFAEMFGDPRNNHHGWPVARLGDVARTTSGGTPGRGVPEYFGGPIPWVKSGELYQETVTGSEETLTARGVAESSAKVMPPGTVLVAMYGATVGAVATLGIAAATNQAVCCIQPGREVEPVYLVQLLKHLTPSLLAKRVGGAQPNLSQELLRNMRIVVPPHDAQREFSKRISAINRLKATQSASLAEMDALFVSLQHRAFRGEL